MHEAEITELDKNMPLNSEPLSSLK
ncbi:unknown protein [Waddlia chondrophila 2032/99]|uniref:Uncharacterized protein n=1 Tax=Waddlia chondrophila 2032/99 TaxID=765953 RepID=F8L9Y6_9BACT|nr:unknown protein [Waddlia chondrophila 2032/99]